MDHGDEARSGQRRNGHGQGSPGRRTDPRGEALPADAPHDRARGHRRARSGSRDRGGVVVGRITYYLPSPDGSTEATKHDDWIESVLALIPVSLVAGLLALVATVLGIVALVRRREAALWQLVLAGLALVIALAVLVVVPSLLNGIGTY